MREYIKTYHVELITQSPIFIGDGGELNKKEYIQKGRMIYVPSLEKMYQYLSEHGLAKEYESFMLDDSSRNLGKWMEQNKVPLADIKQWTNYQLDFGDISQKPLELKTFIKDAYGCPYIPGSSLKGALRTILLAYMLKTKRDYFSKNRQEIAKEAKESNNNRNYYLRKQTDELEVRAFHSLNRLSTTPKELNNAVNDIMSCLHISDSRPLRVEDLTVCQKIDISNNGIKRPLNTTRECIRPNTRIEFDLTITNEFPFSITEIRKAIDCFAEEYYQNFFSHFPKIAPELTRPKEKTLWIGGGAGYVSKTIVYQLLGYKEGLKTTATIMQKTVSNKTHRHSEDVRRGVSPHMLKCTKCQGKVYEFGRCSIYIS